ncbi:unnamed protein product [Rotaria sp. Silwood2]|nr:unnamed protein product [Rotaria sp. Silwood2]CAF4287901.1 unnamed protein product [Rotaria sp. Silwood2]
MYLKAYAVHYLDVGYCHVQTLIAAFLLLIHLRAEQTCFDDRSDVMTRTHKCDNFMDLVALIEQNAKQLSFNVFLAEMDKLSLADIDLA